MLILRLSVACSLLATIGCTCRGPGPNPPPADRFGRFDGEVNATFLEDGRKMKLGADFSYHDPHGIQWDAPAGAEVDGASIPQAFWSLIGGPFSGKFRNASVVHDVACDAMKRPWQDVHQMFYEACRCAGVSESKAKLMYWAVYHRGPRWKQVQEVRVEDGVQVMVKRMVRDDPPPADEALVKQAEEYFAAHNPSLSAIEALEL